MSLPRSSYYHIPKPRRIHRGSIIDRIEQIAEEYETYGYRQITAQLHREGSM